MSAEAPLPTHLCISRRQFCELAKKTVEAAVGAAIVSSLPTPVLAQGPVNDPSKCNSPDNQVLRNQGYTVNCDQNGNVISTWGPGYKPGKQESLSGTPSPSQPGEQKGGVILATSEHKQPTRVIYQQPAGKEGQDYGEEQPSGDGLGILMLALVGAPVAYFLYGIAEKVGRRK